MGFVSVTEMLVITIDRSRLFDDVMTPWRNDCADEEITEEHFPSGRVGDGITRIEVALVDKGNDEELLALTAEEFQDAELLELLTLGENQPHILDCISSVYARAVVWQGKIPSIGNCTAGIGALLSPADQLPCHSRIMLVRERNETAPKET